MNINKTNRETQMIRQKFEKLIGAVTAKKLFLGYGLFYDESLMFGIYHYETERFYIRAETREFVEYLKSMGSRQWIKAEPSLAISNYYTVPQSIERDSKTYQRVLILSISEQREKRLLDELNRKNRLRDMVNLSLKHERLLKKVGISNVKEFQVIGPETAYVRLKKASLPVTEQLFWIFVAALKNKPVELLTENEKRKALEAINPYLIEEGIKPIKANNSS